MTNNKNGDQTGFSKYLTVGPQYTNKGKLVTSTFTVISLVYFSVFLEPRNMDFFINCSSGLYLSTISEELLLLFP